MMMMMMMMMMILTHNHKHGYRESFIVCLLNTSLSNFWQVESLQLYTR